MHKIIASDLAKEIVKLDVAINHKSGEKYEKLIEKNEDYGKIRPLTFKIWASLKKSMDDCEKALDFIPHDSKAE